MINLTERSVDSSLVVIADAPLKSALYQCDAFGIGPKVWAFELPELILRRIK